MKVLVGLVGLLRLSQSLAQSLGTVRVLVLLSRFSNHANRPLPSRESIQTLCDSQIVPYFQQQSYGQYNVVCDVLDWVTSSYTEAAIAQGNQGLIGPVPIQDLFVDALNAADASAAGDVEFWTKYDSNGDGFIDLVAVLHSGYDSSLPGTDCTNTAATPPNRIHSQAYSGLRGQGWTSSAATLSYGLNNYCISPALLGRCGEIPQPMGVLAHEWTHTLGPVPDLYQPTNIIAGVGGFDIMSSIYGPTGTNGASPGSMGPWVKQRIGWITPTEIAADGTYQMRPATSFPDYFIIRQGYAANEYLLMEFRVPTSFDADFFAPGMILYHIDDNAELQSRPGFPGQSGWPQNGNHYQVAVLQADGLYDLEQNRNLGDAGDLYTPGSSIGPGTGSNFPNTDSYSAGVVQSTGITITVVSMDTSLLTFSVQGMSAASPVASPVQAPVVMPVPSPAPTLSPVQAASPTQSQATSPPVQSASPTQTPVASAPVQPPSPVQSPVAAPTGSPVQVSSPVQGSVAPTSSPVSQTGLGATPVTNLRTSSSTSISRVVVSCGFVLVSFVVLS